MESRRRSRSPTRRGRRSDEKRRGQEDVSSGRKRQSRRSRSRSAEAAAKRRRERRESEREKENNTPAKRRDEEKKKESEEKVKEKEEVHPPQPARPLSKRELERQKLAKELEESDAVEDEGEAGQTKNEENLSRSCPYLDTINRSVLDFDFEKLCSVSLSTMNIYACMICGKYYQGRGMNTLAYTHSLDTDHRVFLNLLTLKFYCLPDNYEICDPSLEDIKYVVKPTYSKTLIASLNSSSKMSRAYDDSTYYPGVVGLNNIKANDYCNAVLHALSHVTPLRDYFLQEENYAKIPRSVGDLTTELPKRFGELLRKLWNPRAFRRHVSPHEMLQAVVMCSKKKFQITEQSDAAEFLNFLLNTLHIALNGTQKSNSSIIYRTFRGRLRQYSRAIIPAEATEDETRSLLSLPQYQESVKEMPFLYLSMDLPPAPLYRDNQLENIIPQVQMQVLLAKYNGSTEREYKTYKENIMKRFEILRLPEYLIVTYKRFHKNQWFTEKNPTIVTFPITNVDFYDCLAPEVRDEHKYTTYDLLANVVHEGKYEDGHYRIQLHHEGSKKWFELEDLRAEEILPHVIVLGESYIQIWKLNRHLTREQRMNEEKEEKIEPSAGLLISNPFDPKLPPKP